MTELLAPAGSIEALVAAISNGADAIYLGMNRFGARAYANNFNDEDLIKAIYYAHLRKVKIYVTMNTIVYDNELKDAFDQIDKLYLYGVDGIIIQDLALFNYVVKNYPQMEAHCSTQMGIDDIEGALFFKDLGAKRVVLSREVPLEKLKQIKKQTKLPIEIFIHGALCVSYSGNCLMSGLIGYRSGNRGRCVGSCRKPYEVINNTTNEKLTNSYILSMKDLNTINHMDELKFADSLKIEGRMKEPVYVANVVKAYRKALDERVTNNEIKALNKTFNRTYTEGYMFHEDKANIVNALKPNNFGYPIGTITKKINQCYEITLSEELNQQDILRIDHNKEEVNLSVSKLYDEKNNLISSSTTKCYIKIKEPLSIGDIVYKTKDFKFTKEIENTFPKEYKRFGLNLYVYGEAGQPLSLTIECEEKTIHFESDFILEKAVKSPTTKDNFINQFSRLKETVYELKNVEYYVDNAFIPTTKMNDLRRKMVELLNEERLIKRNPISKQISPHTPICFEEKNPEISVYCTTEEQVKAAQEFGIKTIYYKENIIRRNETTYPVKKGMLLIGGYGGIYTYKNTNEFITDYSLNVVNHEMVYFLHKLGAKRITLSYEINHEQIKELLSSYYEKNKGYPNLEMIVYGRAPMMFTHYCPLKSLKQCGKCKTNEYILKDEYGYFPIESHEDCTTTILNGKILNLIDDIQNIKHITAFRIQLTKESYEESKKIIERFLNKLTSSDKTSYFNKETDTRGHFNKEIL